MKFLSICAICLLQSLSYAQQPSAAFILDKIDENMYSTTKVIMTTMTIHGRRESRTIEAKSWIRGNESGFTEYLAPAREKGVKMLKLGDQLWTYSPDTDRTIRIAGHMLRQSIMGSDLSYEDAMEDPRLKNLYEGTVTESTTIDGRPCWAVDLTAKKADVAYYKRSIWVDKERFIVLKEDRYAKSGKLLKQTTVKEVAQFDGRWFPTKIVFKDVLKTGNGTEYSIDSIQFDVPIPDYIFSKAALRK
jgi:outer membrane lipoprotein-sorting protein